MPAGGGAEGSCFMPAFVDSMDLLIMHFFGRFYVVAMILQTNIQTGVTLFRHVER
jgi:hypothetical protein